MCELVDLIVREELVYGGEYGCELALYVRGV